MTINQRKTALVFGGSRGIGGAAVEQLVKDGFETAFTYVSRPDSAHWSRTLGPSAAELSPSKPTAVTPRLFARPWQRLWTSLDQLMLWWSMQAYCVSTPLIL